MAFDELEVEVLLAVQREAHHRPPGWEAIAVCTLPWSPWMTAKVDQGHQAKDRIGEGRKTAFWKPGIRQLQRERMTVVLRGDPAVVRGSLPFDNIPW